MKKHICFMANAASIHTVRWVNYFAEHGWNVDLLTWHPPSSSNKLHPDIGVHRLLFPPHYVARYGALLEIFFLMKMIHPDIVHAHYISTFGILAGLYGRLAGFRPIVLTAWGPQNLSYSKGMRRKLQKLSIKVADLVTCDGENTVEELVKLGTAKDKIAIIYFGTDTRSFSPEKRDEKLRSDLGVLDSPTVISLRSFQPVYDIESLIKAVPLVLKEISRAKFLVFGEGPQESYLKGLAHSLGVSDSIRFLGVVSHDELPRYLASSDVYVSTSLSDGGLSVSTSEAMACGLPVVITDFGDNNKWVEDGVSGFLVPLRNPEALAKKIVYLLQNEEKRKSFGKVGRRVIEERNSYEKEMGKVEKLYAELIEKSKK